MTDEQKAALARLDHAIDGTLGCATVARVDALVLKQMIAEPRLPQQPPPRVLEVLRNKLRNDVPEAEIARTAYECYVAIYNALQPTVLAWRVNYVHADGVHKGSVQCADCEGALAQVRMLVRDGVQALTIEQVEVQA